MQEPLTRVGIRENWEDFKGSIIILINGTEPFSYFILLHMTPR